jgi:hypothetical protein
MNHHHEAEWRATCERRQTNHSWQAASTCNRHAKRSLWTRILSLFGV